MRSTSALSARAHWRTGSILLAAALAVAACGGDSEESGDGLLVGTFAVDAAVCDAGAPESGSYFRMIQGGGTVADGPFVPNGDSTCGDSTYTALEPGTAGLVTAQYQPQPADPFDASKNGVADAIVAPTKFFGVNFALSTNETDPVSGEAVPAPSLIVADDGTVSGDLRALSVAWNGQQFNQGAPKPDGSAPGLTTPVTGTYDSESGRYTLTWISQIVGGPFDGFSGVWYLEGEFTPDS